MADLPQVVKGDPHVAAHNAERTAINGLATVSEEALINSRAAVWSSTQEALAPQIVMRKSTQNPILETSDTTLPSIYWPSVMRVDEVLANPLGKYYMWFSTDHGQANASIALAYADDLEGPWTFYGSVFSYVTSGTETETPSVVIDHANHRLLMYHQQVGPTNAVSAQVTMAASSTDGISWTSLGIVLDVREQSGWRGPLHTGYFRASNIGNGFIGYGLLQGQENPTFAIWHSTDGLNWVLDSRPLGYEAHYLRPEYRVEWNTANIVLWRGRYVLVFLVSTFASGSEGRTSYWAVAPLAPNFRSLAGPPQKLFGATQAWETSETGQGHAFVDDGRLVLMWRGGNGTTKPFGFGVAFADPTSVPVQQDYSGETVAYSLVRDPTGAFVPIGRTEHVLAWTPMVDTALPSWITSPVSGSLTTVQNVTNSTNPPRVRAETAATVNAAVRHKFGPLINVSTVEEVEFRLDGLLFSHDDGFDFRYEIGNDNQIGGLDYRQDSGEVAQNNTRGRFRTHGASSAVFVDRTRAVYFGKPDGAGRRPSTISLLWRPRRYEAYILMGDQVMAAMQYDPSEIALTGSVQCQFTMNTKLASARAAMYQGAQVKVRYN